MVISDQSQSIGKKKWDFIKCGLMQLQQLEIGVKQ